MASPGIGIDRHVLFDTRQRTAAGDRTQKFAKLSRIESIPEGKEIGETSDLSWSQEIQRGKVACLIDLISCQKAERLKACKLKDLVDVCFLLCEAELCKTLVLDLLEQVVLE